ncbi:MAG: sulfatase-like hydrolase/transferase [Sedimentisphaerales bacterium]|nr:sulfatase-like hydrolase/transferase [Sedimentisphaerales bacterium]
MKRKRHIIIILIFLLIICVAFSLVRNRKSKPIRNVLLISIDTCRADHLSCYGYPEINTPHIDNLAREGILFENAYASVPLTLPSHTTMLTGLIPPYHGIHDNYDYRVEDRITTLAEVFKENGFVTGAAVSTYILDSQFNLDQGFDTYNDYFEQLTQEKDISERKGDETTLIAQEWIEEHKDKPFFFFLHYYDPHGKYEPPAPFDKKFPTNPYVGEIAFTDYCIGQVVKTLKDSGLYDSTMVIITSDHGEMLYEHEEPTHSYYIYQSAIKVPLIFKMPGMRKAKRIQSPAGLTDIVPTVCALLHMAAPQPQHGMDLSGVFDQKKPIGPSRDIYCESLIPTKYNANSLLGVVNDRWKYIQTTRPELYDILNDPREQTNLYQTDQNRARILQVRLKEMLDQSIRETSDSKYALDAEGIKRLESLGYVAGSGITEEFEFTQDKADPKDMLKYHNDSALIKELIAQKKYEQAYSLCAELVARVPTLFEGHESMGEIALGRHQYAAALAYLEKAIEINPHRHETYYKMGTAYLNLGQFDQAVNYFEKALEIGSEDYAVYNNLAMALIRLNDIDQAIDYLNKAVAVNPQRCFEAHCNLGRLYSKQAKLDLAITHWEHAISMNSEVPLVHHNLAEAYMQKHNLTKAVEHWKITIALQPGHADALNNLAWSMAAYPEEEFYNPKTAVQLARRALETVKGDPPHLLDTLAIAYAASGNFTEAIDTAKKAYNSAVSLKQDQLAREINSRLLGYQEGIPYQENP